MRVLIVHNRYRQPGGEDVVYASEAALLEDHGHEVIRFERNNDSIPSVGKIALVRGTLWNGEVYRELRRLIRTRRPDVVHCHNTFPLVSPAAYYAAREEGVPVVQTLHNYRLICLNSLLFRDGRVCESCVGRRLLWPGIRHGCYRGSRTASAVVASHLLLHRLIGTWKVAVDQYIALTKFARRKLIEGGLPAGKILVKPNFVHPDPGVWTGEREYGLFVGRISREKGIETLIRAWGNSLGVPLRVVGNGPHLEWAIRMTAALGIENVEFLGFRGRGETLDLIKRAKFLVMPSEWYEPFGLVIVEAFACGTPVIVARSGAGEELVAHGRTGLVFEPGNPRDLAAKVGEIVTRPGLAADMGREARREFEQRYNAEQNYRLLLGIYRRLTEA